MRSSGLPSGSPAVTLLTKIVISEPLGPLAASELVLFYPVPKFGSPPFAAKVPRLKQLLWLSSLLVDGGPNSEVLGSFWANPVHLFIQGVEFHYLRCQPYAPVVFLNFTDSAKARSVQSSTAYTTLRTSYIHTHCISVSEMERLLAWWTLTACSMCLRCASGLQLIDVNAGLRVRAKLLQSIWLKVLGGNFVVRLDAHCGRKMQRAETAKASWGFRCLVPLNFVCSRADERHWI